MSLARTARWPTRTVFRPATSAHLLRRRIGEQYFQVRRDRLELLDAAILGKRREKVVTARGHASWLDNVLTKETQQWPSPFGFANLTLTYPNSLHLRCLPKCFRHQILQRFEFGPPPRQCSSVVVVIEVGALSMEADRALQSKIAHL